MGHQILIIIVLLLFSGFFSGMEIAYLSSNKMQMEIEKKQLGLLGNVLERLTRNPSKFITTMLVGNNIVMVVYGMFSAKLMQSLLPAYFQNILWHTFFSTVVIVITAEFLPKVFFQIYSNTVLKAFCIPAYFIYLVLSPISSFIMWISNTILRVFFPGSHSDQTGFFSKADLSDYISGQINKQRDDFENELHIFHNALSFSDVKAREVMVPRPEIVSLSINDSIEHLRELFVSTKFSKILIYKETIDEIIGYVHSFDMFKKPSNIGQVLRPVLNIPESIAISKVLDSLTKKRKSIAVVIDEYGGTSGIITVEDIVEELFGEIEDEHDKAELTELQISSTEFVFSCRLEVDYVNEKYKIELPKSEEYETIGGLIVFYNQSIPLDGDKVDIDKYSFTIEEVTDNKILRVRMSVKEDE